MKNFKKLTVLLGIIPMMLTSCQDFEKKAYCLETCDTPDYVSGQCYQASSKDLLESVHLIALPTNPDKADDEDYKYPLTWNSIINTEYFTLTNGLEGKRVMSVLKLGENVIKVNITGASVHKDATYGYIKVSYRAFKSYVSETREAYVYAYVAVGENPSMVEKPANYQNPEAQVEDSSSQGEESINL